MKKNKKLLALVCCMALLVVSAGATLAWLTAQTQTVTNTFTASDINITLEETDATGDVDQTKSYEMVPGATLEKDPTVTVLAGSEACYVFVEVTKSNTFDTYITAVIDDSWTLVPETTNVYYQLVDEVAAGTAEADLPKLSVLKGNEVAVNTGVTKAMMEALNAEDAVQPTIAFKAYAVQQAHLNVTEAWQAAQGLKTN